MAFTPKTGFKSYTNKEGKQAFVQSRDPNVTEDDLDAALEAHLKGLPTSGFTVLGPKAGKVKPLADTRSTFARGRSALIGGMEKALQPLFGESVGKVGRFAAEVALPETPAGLAADVALAGASLIPPLAPVAGPALAARKGAQVTKALSTLKKTFLGTKARALTTRAAAPVVAATGTAAATGGDIPSAAVVGATAGVTELSGPVVRGAKRLKGQFATRRTLVAQGTQDAIAVRGAIIKDNPVFKKVLPGKANDLVKFRAKEKGKAALKTLFDQSDAAIKKSFKDTPLRLELQVDLPPIAKGPGFNPEALKAIRSELKTVQSFTPEAALTKLKGMKKAARARGADFETVIKPAREFEEQFRGVLAGKDKSGKLLATYDRAVDEFRRGSGLLKIFEKSGAMLDSPSGPFMDLGKLSRFLTKNIERYSPKDYPQLYAVAARGKGVGAADLIKEITFRGIVPRVGAANIKLFNLLVKAGVEPPSLLIAGKKQLPTSLATLRAGEAALTPSEERQQLSGSPF